MDHEKMLSFVEKMTKHALGHIQHFDGGGPVNAIGGATQGLASAFTAQNGYQAQLAPTTQIDYATPAAGAVGNINQGYGQNQDLLSQQQALGKQFSDQTRGEGPNPAQAALARNTGQNIASQASLMAGQRGAGANAGLLARQSAQQGAATQQNAVGQASVLDAQQRQQAAQNLQAQQTAEQSTIQGEQGIQGNLYGASANANNAQNNTNVSNYNMAQGINSQVAQANAAATNATTGSVLNSVGGALGSMFAKGGTVGPLPAHLHKMASAHYAQHMSDGGSLMSLAPLALMLLAKGGKVDVPPQKMAAGGSANFGVDSPGASAMGLPNLMSGAGPAQSSSSQKGSGLSDLGESAGSSANSGMGGTDASGATTANAGAGYMGESFGFAKGGNVGSKMKSGGKVPGKPKVGHDSYGNDTVSAKLSPGEVVIDLDTLHDEGKLGQMARFVAQNIERRKMGRKP